MSAPRSATVNGAESVLQTLAGSGVELCFANPGTSEMHLVAALDRVPAVRGVLALFEGVASGAADGYGRMADKPAATLLHLGPGLGNAFANLHNAFRARTPLVNLVGEHGRAHRPLDAPLTSDIEAIAGPVSAWVRTVRDARGAATDAAAAVAAAMSGACGIATLILPADSAWEASAGAAPPVAPRPPTAVPEAAAETARAALGSGEPAALLLGGRATRAAGLRAAADAAAATGARVLCDTFPARLERGGSRPEPERLPYLGEMAMATLEGLRHLVVVETKPPVAFFAYPGKPSELVPEGCEVHVLATAEEDGTAALQALADELGAAGEAAREDRERPQAPTGGPVNGEALAAAVGALLHEGAIVVDESATAGVFLLQETAAAPEHDWLFLTGGSIGMGLPAATGAALACPDRPVLCLEGDGSAMYTPQALWTQAREDLNVTTVILANRSYAILGFELMRVGAHESGTAARDLLDIDRPDIDFVALSQSMGVPARRVDDAAAFVAALREDLAEPGPRLIEAVLG